MKLTSQSQTRILSNQLQENAKFRILNKFSLRKQLPELKQRHTYRFKQEVKSSKRLFSEANIVKKQNHRYNEEHIDKNFKRYLRPIHSTSKRKLKSKTNSSVESLIRIKKIQSFNQFLQDKKSFNGQQRSDKKLKNLFSNTQQKQQQSPFEYRYFSNLQENKIKFQNQPISESQKKEVLRQEDALDIQQQFYQQVITLQKFKFMQKMIT